LELHHCLELFDGLLRAVEGLADRLGQLCD
jgi:hypothetical protein